jgi:signal transduction histidine kinase
MGNRKMKKMNLMDMSHRMSLMISTITIVVVQLFSISVITWYMVADLDRKADLAADEIAEILVEPLYNVDDGQAKRIGEALVSSGRISGIVIESIVSGTILEIKPPRVSVLIEPRSRNILYKLIRLGSVRFSFSDTDLFDMVRNIVITLVIVVLAVMFVSVLFNHYLVQQRINGVFARLAYGINGISGGRYDRVIPESGYLDMDAVIKMINEMAANIQVKNQQLLGMNKLLEQRVSERTVELEAALAEQRLLQDRLIESGKLSALGQLAAGVAHELNTPLGAISSSGRILIDYLDTKAPNQVAFVTGLDRGEFDLFRAIMNIGIRENKTLSLPIPSRSAVRDAAKALSERGVSNADSIASSLCDVGISDSLEEFVSLFGTSRDLEVVQNACEPVIARRMAQVIGESATKAASVVSALRSYLMPESAEKHQIVDIDADITKVLTLMHNMLKHGIVVKTDFSRVHVLGSSDKLSQVWMNLIRNAAQAMDFRGVLSIGTAIHEGMAIVTVEDSGVGISDSIRDKIFEPFFTTKKSGDGMGLGLDICKKIIEKHHGTISFESRPGWTVFTVMLPAVSVDDSGSVTAGDASGVSVSESKA